MPSAIVLKDAYKQYTLDQDKVIPPQETVQRIKHKLKQLDLNILERTVRIDNGRLDIPVFFSICGDDARRVTGTQKQMGKGATPEQAEASAVMELCERYSFFSFSKNPDNFHIDTYPNVKKAAIPFQLIAQSVHDDSEELAQARAVFETLPLKWTRAYNLTLGDEVLVPFDWFFMINEFNGPSAGNCTEEALSQGICEIVERHVSSLISRSEVRVPAINPDSVTDPKSLEMIQKYKRAGIRLFLSDFTLDMGIPTIGALAYDPKTFPDTSEIVRTAGTTPDPQKALSRTLTEVAQLAGDFNSGSRYVASGLPKFRDIRQADYITRSIDQRDLSELPNLSHNNIRIEVENCLSALKQKSMQVLAIDTMHPLLEIPAFYTIIPGAHFRERATGTSVGMFSAKFIAENKPPLEAIRILKQIETLLPRQYYNRFFIGICYLSLLDPESALPYFQQALILEPAREDLPSIYSYMGVCLKDMGKYAQALEVLEKGCRIDNERTDLYNLMGFCHFKRKEHEQAIECFQKVIDLDPSSAIDYANIGSNYRDLGKTEKAIHYYNLALMLDPSIGFARENLVLLKKESI